MLADIKGFLTGKTVVMVSVKPRSYRDEIVLVGESLVVRTRALATAGLANEAVVKLFKKLLGMRVEIVSGFQSRQKKVKLVN